jgi:hypothetical protein
MRPAMRGRGNIPEEHSREAPTQNGGTVRPWPTDRAPRRAPIIAAPFSVQGAQALRPVQPMGVNNSIGLDKPTLHNPRRGSFYVSREVEPRRRVDPPLSYRHRYNRRPAISAKMAIHHKRKDKGPRSLSRFDVVFGGLSDSQQYCRPPKLGTVDQSITPAHIPP